MNRAPSPFEIGQAVGTNIAKGFTAYQDKTALDDILEKASRTQDPNVINDVMGQILQRVSPERQQVALGLLQQKQKFIQDNIEKQQKLAIDQRERQTKIKMGVDPDLPTPLAKEAFKTQQKDKRIASVFGEQPQGTSQGQGTNSENPFAQFSDDKLVALTGAPDREISEPAKTELRRRQEAAKAAQSQFEPEADKLEAKRVNELATEVEKEFQSATNENMRLERQLQLDKEGNVSTPALIKIMDTFGVPIGVLGNPATEEFRKLEADYVRDVSKVFPGGRITNYEIGAYLKTIPSLMNSPEGRKQIIANRKLMNEAKRVRYDAYKQILGENNGKKPQNLGVLLEERTAPKLMDIEDRYINNINEGVDKFQQPIRMFDPQGNPVDIPPNKIEAALKAGARFK